MDSTFPLAPNRGFAGFSECFHCLTAPPYSSPLAWNVPRRCLIQHPPLHFVVCLRIHRCHSPAPHRPAASLCSCARCCVCSSSCSPPDCIRRQHPPNPLGRLSDTWLRSSLSLFQKSHHHPVLCNQFLKLFP